MDISSLPQVGVLILIGGEVEAVLPQWRAAARDNGPAADTDKNVAGELKVEVIEILEPTTGIEPVTY